MSIFSGLPEVAGDPSGCWLHLIAVERGHPSQGKSNCQSSGREIIMTAPNDFDRFQVPQTGFDVVSSVKRVPGHAGRTREWKMICSASAIEFRAVRAHVCPGTGHAPLMPSE